MEKQETINDMPAFGTQKFFQAVADKIIRLITECRSIDPADNDLAVRDINRMVNDRSYGDKVQFAEDDELLDRLDCANTIMASIDFETSDLGYEFWEKKIYNVIRAEELKAKESIKTLSGSLANAEVDEIARQSIGTVITSAPEPTQEQIDTAVKVLTDPSTHISFTDHSKPELDPEQQKLKDGYKAVEVTKPTIKNQFLDKSERKAINYKVLVIDKIGTAITESEYSDISFQDQSLAIEDLNRMRHDDQYALKTHIAHVGKSTFQRELVSDMLYGAILFQNTDVNDRTLWTRVLNGLKKGETTD